MLNPCACTSTPLYTLGPLAPVGPLTPRRRRLGVGDPLTPPLGVHAEPLACTSTPSMRRSASPRLAAPRAELSASCSAISSSSSRAWYG